MIGPLFVETVQHTMSVAISQQESIIQYVYGTGIQYTYYARYSCEIIY